MYRCLFIALSCCISFQLSNAQQTQDSSTSASENFIVKKGRFFNSLTFSLDQRKAENESQLLREVIDQDRYNFTIVTSGGYAIKDNFTLGLGLAYGREQEEITFLNQDNENVTSKSVEQGFSIAPQMRNYIPIGNGMLQVLIQTELNFTFGESLERNFFMDRVDKIEGNFTDIKLGVSPGAVLFFNPNWAFEARVDVVGLSFRKETSVANNDLDNKTKIIQTGADLRINLLRLNLGVARYF